MVNLTSLRVELNRNNLKLFPNYCNYLTNKNSFWIEVSYIEWILWKIFGNNKMKIQCCKLKCIYSVSEKEVDRVWAVITSETLVSFFMVWTPKWLAHCLDLIYRLKFSGSSRGVKKKGFFTSWTAFAWNTLLKSLDHDGMFAFVLRCFAMYWERKNLRYDFGSALILWLLFSREMLENVYRMFPASFIKFQSEEVGETCTHFFDMLVAVLAKILSGCQLRLIFWCPQ